VLLPRLVLRNAFRHKLRTTLTIVGIVVAITAFGMLRTIVDAWYAGANASSSARLVTRNAVSLVFPLPLTYAAKLRQVPGVASVTWANWFGGVYKDPQNFFAQYAIEQESYLRMYPEILLASEEKRAFLDDRTGCIVGEGLARNYGFKIGDKITLQVGIPTYGTRDFDFTVRGIYKSGGAAVDNLSMFFHWKYADERSVEKGLAGWYIAQISNPDQAAQIWLHSLKGRLLVTRMLPRS
jgi:putative ABC transport system permease protein